MITAKEHKLLKEAVETLRYFGCGMPKYKEVKRGRTIKKVYEPRPSPSNPYLCYGLAEERVLKFVEEKLEEFENRKNNSQINKKSKV